MAVLIRFPKVAANVEEGMVGAWRKRVGDRVARDEPLVELITDKATFELPAETDGTLLRILAEEKSTVPVNYVLGILGSPDEAVPDVTEENERLLALHRRRAAADWRPQAGSSVAGGGVPNVRATPSARRLARELGVDLTQVVPADGRVVRDDDVRRHATAKQ